MRTQDFPAVKTARKVVEEQIEVYNELISEENMAKKKLFIVDTIVTFRHRYVIEANELEHAYDEVTMIDSGNDSDLFEPVSSKCLGETIIDGRKISKKKFNELLNTLENDSSEQSSYWMGDDLIRKINYD